jgi:hypothetical protein
MPLGARRVFSFTWRVSRCKFEMGEFVIVAYRPHPGKEHELLKARANPAESGIGDRAAVICNEIR